MGRGHVNHDSSRLTFDQFVRVAYGCFLGRWFIPESSIRIFSEAFAAIEDALTSSPDFPILSGNTRDSNSSHDTTTNAPDSTTPWQARYTYDWIRLFADAARSFLNESDVEYTNTRRLVLKGYRSSSEFVETADRHESLFGLINTQTMLSYLAGPEA